MTCFAVALTAPTTQPSSSASSEYIESTTLKVVPITAQEPSTTNNEALPEAVTGTVTASHQLDIVTNNEMKTFVDVTTTSEPLIVTKSQSDVELRSSTALNNGTIKVPSEVPTTPSNLDENTSIKYAPLSSVASATIELPIRVDAADNLRVMEDERAPLHSDVEAKKGKLKEGKKKALKGGTDKKPKLKMKLINHPTIVPLTNEPTNPTDKATEATVSTSIKTAPTTIKSTTLATIKSFQLESDTTEPLTKATVSTLHTNDAEEEEEATTTASGDHHRNDNVIVLNTNGSGLIVVDIMENFGMENASTETFEIKMDLIDDATTTNAVVGKDDIVLTTIETPSTIDSSRKSTTIDTSTTTNDDIILINESSESATSPASQRIRWNQVKSDESNIKITFDNIDLPNQNVNVSIENGELVIDSIDISVLNRAEEELKKKRRLDVSTVSRDSRKLNKTDSLEIILIEDDSRPDEKDNNQEATMATDEERIIDDFRATTIHFDLPATRHDHHLKSLEVGGDEDGIKIKTTDKDSDTVFYISNTEVKVIESIPTTSPNVSQKKYFPAIYEEDVIVDVPSSSKNRSVLDKYEEDIVLSPLTSDFDPKDINYIGEAFLDVEESQNGNSENRHIIPLTSDVVIQPVQLRDSPSIGIPIIGEVPPQIELEEMVFSDDYDNKQQSNFRVEEYYPNFLSNRLVKNQLEADVPKELIFDSKNGTLLSNRTHISVNTMINGTNMTTVPNSVANATAFLLEEDATSDNAGEFICLKEEIDSCSLFLPNSASCLHYDNILIFRPQRRSNLAAGVLCHPHSALPLRHNCANNKVRSRRGRLKFYLISTFFFVCLTSSPLYFPFRLLRQ